MKIKLLTLTMFLGAVSQGSAQKIYKTVNGHIEMMAMADNELIKAESHNLALYLDYDAKVVKGILDLKTLSTNYPKINTILQEKEENLMLSFSGTIPNVDFLSHQHEPINFNWLIDVTYQGETFKSQFKAIITHIDQGLKMSCLISATGQILTSDTGLNSLIQGLQDTIEVQFSQLVLKLE